MAKAHIEDNGKRVIFLDTGAQEKFLETALTHSGLSIKNFAEAVGANQRTLNYWRCAHTTLPLITLNAICRKFKLGKPSNIELREAFWSTKKAALLGGKATYKKYGTVGGSPEYRKEKWRAWYAETGKNALPQSFKAVGIRKPPKTADLAEFVGILLGDGGITSSQITISLHIKEVAYKNFICTLIKKLFHTDPKVYERPDYSVTIITISSVELVSFCMSLGLVTGNKVQQQVDVPDWIKKSQKFSVACLRGLVDTDGSVYNECHTIKEKRYCYPRLAFTNSSKPLLHFADKILRGLAFSSKIRNNVRVQVENIEEIRRYFKVVGSHNPKHASRFQSFGGVG